jgi:putative drug exporter of the RND superfamily
MSTLLERLGRAAVRHPWRFVAVWIALAAVLVGAGRAAGGTFTDDYRVPGVESQRAADLLRERFPAVAGADSTIVMAVPSGTLADHRAAVEATLAQVAAQPHVVAVERPLADGGGGGVSADGRIAFAGVRYDVPVEQLGVPAFERLDEAAGPARAAGVTTEFSGQVAEAASNEPVGAGEAAGLLAALVILLLAFGSVVAAGLPIVTALVGLAVGLAAVMLVGALVDVPTTAPILAVMIGLGVGIDYALFVITRHRQLLAAGHGVERAAGLATATAGQAVVVAGGTVVIAILGLYVTGIPFVGAMGLAAAVVVAVAVLAAVTLLPALLGLAGARINRRSARRAGRPAPAPAGSSGTGGRWARWARHVDRHARLYALTAVALLLVLAAPVLSLRLGMPDEGSKATSSTQRRAYDLLGRGFGPGVTGPLVLAVELPEGAAAGKATLERLARAAAADPGVAAVGPPSVNPAGDTAVLGVIPRSAPADPATAELVERLRTRVVPAAKGQGDVWVGGFTASMLDLAGQVSDRLWLFVASIVGLSFVLLVVVFRSLLVPLKAALLNLLSIGAAYGVVVAVFQWGWGMGLVGLEATVPIMSFVPLLMFAVLFGLSMDYEVFLMSRVREEHLAGADGHRAVVTGISATARVITSAALIMVGVFAAFVANTDPVVKMLGVGLAVAVALDATIVRTVLVPAVMSLLGRRAWWLPAWLDRALPHLDLEAARPAPAPAPEPVGAGR